MPKHLSFGFGFLFFLNIFISLPFLLTNALHQLPNHLVTEQPPEVSLHDKLYSFFHLNSFISPSPSSPQPTIASSPLRQRRESTQRVHTSYRPSSSDSVSTFSPSSSSVYPSDAFSGEFTPIARKLVQLRVSNPATETVRYLLPVSAGTPSQTPLWLILDTGSFTTMMFSKSQYCGIVSIQTGTCFDSFASTTYVSANRTLPYNLFIDNQVISSIVLTGNDTVTLSTNLYASTVSELLTATSTLSIVNSMTQSGDAPLLHSYSDSNGVLGASYVLGGQPNPTGGQSLSAFLSLLAQDSETPFRPIFSLDFNWHWQTMSPFGPFYTGNPSYLYIGGVAEKYADSIQWSEPQGTDADPPAFHSFTVYDLSLCGANLLSNFTDMSFMGIVDTGSSCLTLPAELFDAVVAWLPMDCQPTQTGDGVQCYIFQRMMRLPINATALPTISFRMSPEGEMLYVKLADLLIDSVACGATCVTPPRTRLCIVRGYSVFASVGGGRPEIIFGALTLRSLFAAFSMNTYQVGLANKATTTSSNELCLPPLACQGMQTAFGDLNMCIDPPCDKYYFFDYDSDTHNCVMGQSFEVVALLTIAIFAFTELGLNELQNYLSNKIYRTVPAT